MANVLGEALHRPRWRHVQQWDRLPRVHDIVPTDEAATDAELMLLASANRDWELIGTNVTNDAALHVTDGGILLATAGADSDSTILVPRLPDATTEVRMNRLSVIEFRPELRPRYCARFAAVEQSAANISMLCGLKLNRDLADNDDEAVFFTYEGATTLIAHANVGGVNTAQALDLGFAPGTELELSIDVDERGRAVFAVSIVGGDRARRVVMVSPALTQDAPLIPVAGFAATDTAVAAIINRHLELGCDYGAGLTSPDSEEEVIPE